MASQLPLRLVPPNRESSANNWIAWHTNMRKTFGRGKAATYFREAWAKRGSDSANTVTLRSYLAPYGIVLETGFWEDTADFFSGVGDFFSSIWSFGKFIIIGTVVVVSIVAVLYVLKQVKELRS